MTPRLAPLILLPLLALLALPAAAQAPVPVRTAEHEGYTRVVLDFTARPGWRLGRVPGGFELRLDPAGPGFDLSDVYRRITDARLERVEAPGPGRLRLTAGCDCHATTEELRGGGLVIDIRAGAAPPGNPHEARLDGSAEDVDRPAPRPAAASLPAAAPVALPGLGPRLAAAEVLGMPPPQQLAAEYGAELAAEIRRAAALDLVRPARPAPPATALPAPPPVEVMALDAGAEAAPAPAPNLRVRTEADSALDKLRSASGAPVDPGECARVEALLNPAGWAEPGDGPGGIRMEQAGLVDLRGRVSAEAHLALARQYLFLTFGREARAVLGRVREDLPEASIYAAVGQIVDGGQPRPNPLRGLAACGGHAALWALLADPEARLPAGDPGAAPAFADWPVHLRRALGPRLVTLLRDADKPEMAGAVFRALERVARPEDPGFLLIAAARPGPAPDATVAPALVALAGGQSPEGADALLAVIAARIDEGVPVGSDLAMQAGAMAFEQGDTPAAGRLRAAEARALIHDGLWRAASARVEALEGASRAALEAELVTEAAARAGAGDVLWLAARVAGRSDLAAPVRLALATRVLELGLPDLARQALAIGTAVPAPAERRLLARIALAEKRPGVAEAYLAGLEDAEAVALTAEVAALRAARASLPPADADLGDEAVASEAVAAEAVAALDAPAPDAAANPLPRGGLEAGRSLLGSSEQLRSELQDLLPAPVTQ